MAAPTATVLLKIMKSSGKRLIAALAVILLLCPGAAYGLPDSPVIDSAGELNTKEQVPPRVPAPSLEPDANKKEETADRGASKEDAAKTPSVKEYLKGFPDDVVRGTERIFHRDNVPLAVIGSGLSLIALGLDGKAKKECLEDHPLGRIRNLGNTLGDGFVEVGAGGGLFLAGQVLENRKLADVGIVTLESSLVDGVATEFLKYSVGRRRPNGGGDRMSFPSGHTSVTAAFAASVSEMYAWKPGVAVPLYAAVALVGISRMNCNMHYLSDVLAGATLGTIVGSSVAKYYKEKVPGSRVSLLPIYEHGYKGFLLSFGF